MHIDSVRELKASLPKLLQRRFASTSARAAGNLSVVAARAAREDSRLPSFALGVGFAKGQHRLAVRLQNRRLEKSPLLDEIRKQARGEVDVRYVGRIYALAATPWYRKRQRPLLIGSSCGTVSNQFLMAGTLGCFVTGKTGKKPLILSNNHVLADENRYPKGGAVVQPGTLDGGQPTKDRVAKLKSFVKLELQPAVNLVDAALALVDPDVEIDPSTLRGIGRLAGTRTTALEIGGKVHKVGRTTGVRHGRVTAIELDDVGVEYDIGVCVFDNQIEIEGTGTRSFSDSGDSGSLIVDDELRAAALLFAGGDHGGHNDAGLTYANPIRTVFSKLKVKLLF